MKKLSLVFICVSLFVATLCFFSTNSVVYASIVFVLYVLDFIIFQRKNFTKYNSLIERVHTGHHFINSFVITMSVKDSYDDAFNNATRLSNAKLSLLVRGIKDYSPQEKVKYLKDYFNLSLYKMFLSVLDLYQDQGGNILNMSDNLIRECTRTEKILSETLSIGYKHLIEFIMLWTMALGILVFMRFTISDFYLQMLNNKTVPLMVLIFYIFSLVSLHLFLKSFTNLTIKEDYDICKK